VHPVVAFEHHEKHSDQDCEETEEFWWRMTPRMASSSTEQNGNPFNADILKQHASQEEDCGLDFDHLGTVHRVYPKYRPLGIKHDNVTPIFANEFTVNSYAESALGVRKGWKLVAINGEELTAADSIATTTGKLDAYMAGFQPWPLKLEFKQKLSSDRSEVFEFCERPLGILLHTSSYPVKVASIVNDSCAARLGVKASWYLTKIAGQDVSRGFGNYGEVMKILGEGVAALDRPAKPSAKDLENKQDLFSGHVYGTSKWSNAVAEDLDKHRGTSNWANTVVAEDISA
jgi:hypothetical protein